MEASRCTWNGSQQMAKAITTPTVKEIESQIYFTELLDLLSRKDFVGTIRKIW